MHGCSRLWPRDERMRDKKKHTHTHTLHQQCGLGMQLQHSPVHRPGDEDGGLCGLQSLTAPRLA